MDRRVWESGSVRLVLGPMKGFGSSAFCKSSASRAAACDAGPAGRDEGVSGCEGDIMGQVVSQHVRQAKRFVNLFLR